MHDLESYVLSRKDLLLDENLEIECTIRNLERFHETRIRLSIRASVWRTVYQQGVLRHLKGACLITKMGVPTMLLELKQTKCKPMIENGFSNDDIGTKI